MHKQLKLWLTSAKSLAPGAVHAEAGYLLTKPISSHTAPTSSRNRKLPAMSSRSLGYLIKISKFRNSWVPICPCRSRYIPLFRAEFEFKKYKSAS